MMNQATQSEDGSTGASALHMALEPSRKTWKLAFSDGTARPARVVNVPSRELGEVREQNNVVSHPAKEESIGLVEVFHRVTM